MTSNFHFTGKTWPANSRFIRRGPFTLDLVDEWVTVNNERIQLPSCAFKCLVMLVQNSPKPVSFQELALAPLGHRLSRVDIQDRARMHIFILKRAFANIQAGHSRLKAVPGYGYWLKTY